MNTKPSSFSLDKPTFKMFLGVLYGLATFNASNRPGRNDDGSVPKRTLTFHSDNQFADTDGFCNALAVHDKELSAKTRAFIEAGDALVAHIDSKVSG